MRRISYFCILSALLLSSCYNETEDVDNFARCFFASLSDSEYGKPGDYYHDYDTLKIGAKSEGVDIGTNGIIKKGEEFEVHCMNNYTDDSGIFTQDSVVLYIKRDNENQFYIEKTKGLVKINKEYKRFGYATGALSLGLDLSDRELTKRKVIISTMILSRYYHWKFLLPTEVKILNWSWETSYDGDAHGEGRLINNLDIPISDIKYTVTYYDSRNNFMAKDDGSISKELAPGEKYNFTFWSSHAKYPTKANLKLEFSDKLIYKLVENDRYFGNEYEEFINGLDDSPSYMNLMNL